ncbi:ATP-binding cassette subfamily E, member, partial [Thalictrum thalictroides]
KCPFGAIQIINLPKGLDKDTTHRYGPNSFKLHRLPVPRPGQVLGLVGTNGIGKSTALKILAGILKPNLGRFNSPPDWVEILKYFRGSELQNYFTRFLEDNMKASIKPQNIDDFRKSGKGTVRQHIDQADEREMKFDLCTQLELNEILDREVSELSGGELQRFSIAVAALKKAEIYIFDEPSSYLDVRQRLKAAKVIRSLRTPKSYVIVVEHDLSVLDYLSDFVCCLYGKPGAYGVVTLPFSVREGINIFLAGFLPTENLRFREESITFKHADIYLIDEPSAHFDSEQRIIASKVIKRFILHAKKTAFVVEHDFIMATYLADKVIVFKGKPSVSCTAHAPQSLVTGMNRFLSHLDITFRQDPTNYRL